MQVNNNLLLEKNKVKIPCWKFGADNEKLIKLVLLGEKRATTSLFSEYENDNEPLPKVGDRSIILHDDNSMACLIETEKVIITEFANVTKKWHLLKEKEINP